MIVEKVRGALRIQHVDARAARCGLKRGQALADARACFPSLAVVDADAAADAAFLEDLGLRCDRFSPMVALDAPDGLILDITGCAHLFGGEVELRAQLMADLRRQGLHVRASIAGTPDAARALARFSEVAIAGAGQDEALVRSLPIAAITGIVGETILALSRAGLKTIGALAERPMEALAARFGAGLVTGLLRTLGHDNVRITPLRPRPPVLAERQFAEPLLQSAALEGVLEALIANAAGMLEERGEGGRVFEASFFRSDGAVRRLVVETGRPSRDVPGLIKLYRERMQTLADPIDPGFGFDAIRLGVPVTEPFATVQTQLDGHGLDDDDIAYLIDRLSVRFGCERVLRFAARDTHVPELAARLLPAAAHADMSVACWPLLVAGEPPLRPLCLFYPPQPVEALAEVPDGPPRRFRWRRVQHDVAHAEGPERIAPEWWSASSGASGAVSLSAGPDAVLSTGQRDYYRVEDVNGGRFWMFRDGQYGEPGSGPRWFLHGVFA